MASRRKQTKPKAFGVIDGELDTNGAALSTETAPTGRNDTTAASSEASFSTVNVPPQNTSASNSDTNANSPSESNILNERKRKRDSVEDDLAPNQNAKNPSNGAHSPDLTNTPPETHQFNEQQQETSEFVHEDPHQLLNNNEITIDSGGDGNSNEGDNELIFGQDLTNGEELDDELLDDDDEDDLGDDYDDEDGEEEEDIGLDPPDFNGDDQQHMPNSGSFGGGRYNGQGKGGMLLMFKCRVCGKAFKHRRSLNRHVKLHSGEKNFPCPYCSTAFARSDHLKSHIRTHNNSKPYRCSVCHCGYSTQAALKVHMAHHHARSKFRCVICVDSPDFHSQLALEGHMYTNHSKENSERHDMTDLINETITVKPVLMSAEEAAAANTGSTTSLLTIDHTTTTSFQVNGNSTQRARLSEVNCYNTKRNNETPNHRDYDDEQMVEAGAEEVSGHNEQVFNNPIVEMANNENDDDDDVIIEEELTTIAPKSFNEIPNRPMIPMQSNPMPRSHNPAPLQHIAPKPFGPAYQQGNQPLNTYSRPLPPPPPIHQSHNQIYNHRPHQQQQQPYQNRISGPNPPPPQQLPNTYCELCNARFSNVESYSAHMRNSHPNITQHHHHHSHHPNQAAHSHGPPPQQSSKMPFLTSILANNETSSSSRGTQQQLQLPTTNNKPQQVTPVVRSNAGPQPPVNGPRTQEQPPLPPVCNVPSCNCSMKPQQQPPPPAYNHHPESRTVLTNNQNMNEYFFDDYHIVRDTHYTCVQCQLTVHKLSDYMQHLKQEHCVEVYRCVLCKQMQLFDNLSLLKEHFFVQHQSHKYDVFKCKICLQNPSIGHQANRGFVYVEDLCVHLKSVHNQVVDVNRLRQYCGGANAPPSLPPSNTIPVAPFHRTTGAMTQVASPTGHYPHAPPPPPPPMMPMKCFKCTHCDSDFAQPAALNQHIQMVHRGMPPPPSVNNNPSSQQPQQQQFSCQYCRNTFTQRAQLERHMRIHLTSIDLKCNICDLKFTTHELLNEHKLVHTKAVNQPSLSLSQPSLSVNASQIQPQQPSPGNSSAVCVYCKQVLQNELQFKEHFKRHNNIGLPQPPGTARPTSYMCIVCRQTLTSNQEYALHMRHHLRPRVPPPPLTSTTQQAATQQQQQQSSPTNLTTTAPPKSPNTCQKFLLRCGKCPVKFEYGQDYVEHVRKYHPDYAHNFECLASSLSNDSSSRSTSSNCSSSSSQAKKPSVSSQVAGQSSVKEERRSPAMSATSFNSDATPLLKQALESAPLTASRLLLDHPSSQCNSNNNRLSQQQPTSAASQQQQSNTVLCEICSSKFDTPLRLHCHLIQKHEQQQQQQQQFSSSGAPFFSFSCPVCDESFNRPELLLSHVNVHGPAAKIYKCAQCPAAFVFKSQLINHSFSHQQHHHHQQQHQNAPVANTQRHQATNVSPYSQQPQSAPVMQNQNRSVAFATNRGNNGYTYQTYNRQQQLQSNGNNNRNANNNNNEDLEPLYPHQYTVHDNINGEKTYTCLSCSKTFNTQRNLSVHIRIHTGFRPFQCNVCQRTFTRRENLRSHMKCHLNVRPFTCSICSRSFRRRSHVISHLEVHFKSKLHSCIECAQQFDAIDLFLAHLIQQHQLYDRELLQLIKSKNVLDLTQFHIDYQKMSRASVASETSQYGGARYNGDQTAQRNGADSFYDINEEDFNDDEDTYDDMDGELGEEDLDSNGQDSNEYMPMNKDNELSYANNTISMNTINSKSLNGSVNFNDNVNNQSIFFDNDDLDTVIPSIGLGDCELEIDFAD